MCMPFVIALPQRICYSICVCIFMYFGCINNLFLIWMKAKLWLCFFSPMSWLSMCECYYEYSYWQREKKILKNLIMPFVDLVAYLLKDVMLEVFTEHVWGKIPHTSHIASKQHLHFISESFNLLRLQRPALISASCQSAGTVWTVPKNAIVLQAFTSN